MAHAELEIYDDAYKLSHAAAERILTTIKRSLQEKDTAVLVLAGGNTPKLAYELLASDSYSNRLDWSRVHFFWGDERCVSPDSPESNFGLGWQALISRLQVPPSHVHRIRAELEDSEHAALLYEAEIRRVLAGPTSPSFDLLLLGVGEDGHTASLFPGAHWDEQRLVVSNYVPKLRANRITMTAKLLNESRAVVFLVSGLQKARILAEIVKDPNSNYPASKIRPLNGSLIWMVDRQAASLLTEYSMGEFQVRTVSG